MPHASNDQLRAIISLLGHIEARRRGIPLLTLDRLEASRLIEALGVEHDPLTHSDTRIRHDVADLTDRLVTVAKRLTAALALVAAATLPDPEGPE